MLFVECILARNLKFFLRIQCKNFLLVESLVVLATLLHNATGSVLPIKKHL